MTRRIPIPVYLLTGFLGCGKTTLLSAWLKQPALQDAAVIVNELGEVGLDGALLGVAENNALLSGTCVCCSGLPGLEQALEDLFWAQLERRIPKFPAVAIETTGMADPRPVIAAFGEHPVLRERYRLAGVITVIGAPAALSTLSRQHEARAQVQSGDVLILTKTADCDANAVDAVTAVLRAETAHAPVLLSNHADLALDTVLAALAVKRAATSTQACLGHTAPSHHGSSHAEHGHADHDAIAHHRSADHGSHHPVHQHSAQAYFVALADGASAEVWAARLRVLQSTLQTRLLRIKGIIALNTVNTWAVVQTSADHHEPDIRVVTAAPTGPLGLTVIATDSDLATITALLSGSPSVLH